MKRQINAYDFERISSQMAKQFGAIETYLERQYAKIQCLLESNLLKANRKHGINSGRRTIEAIRIGLFMIDGYLNQTEYDLAPYIADANKPYLTAILMGFDPFTNVHLRPFAEEKCDIYSKEGLHEYFEAPVKCLLRIEMSIRKWTKQFGDDGYFRFLENQIGSIVAHDDKIDCVIVTQASESGPDQQTGITMQEIFPGMSLHEIFTELFPTISKIIEMGFIPYPDELHEITQEEYSAYQRQGGDISQKWYTIIPKNYKYLGPSNEINVLTREDMVKLGKAAIFLQLYADANGCKSQKREDILKFAAERLPAYFTKDTKFERLPIKLLKPGETLLTEKDEFVDLLSYVMGEGTTLNMKITYKDSDENIEKVEEINLPIEKKR